MEIANERSVFLEQSVRIMRGDEVEHFHKVIVVVERRQRPLPTRGYPMCLVVGHYGESEKNVTFFNMLGTCRN